MSGFGFFYGMRFYAIMEVKVVCLYRGEPDLAKHPYQQAGLWGLLNFLLLMSLFTPFNIVSINFVMVPVLIMATQLQPRLFALIYALSLAAVWGLTGTVGLIAILLGLFFLPPAIVMAICYKKRTPARSTLTAGSVAMLFEFLLLLVIGHTAGMNPIDQLRKLMQESIESLPAIVQTQVNMAEFNVLIEYYIQLIPLLLISASVFYVFVTHGVSRWLLGKMNVHVPGLPPLRTWRMPRFLVLLLLVVTIAEYSLDFGTNTTWSMIVWNLQPILTFLFAVQAIGFFFYVAYAKQWPTVLPVMSIVGLVLFFPLVYLYSIIGMLDVVLPLRKRIAG